jgi:hypothetical protein
MTTTSKLTITLGVALVLVVGLVAQAKASSGLRVFVYVHNAVSAIGKEAIITVNTPQDFDQMQIMTVHQANFYVEFEYGPGKVGVGDEIVGCVHIYGESLERCGSTYNSKENIEETVTINLH